MSSTLLGDLIRNTTGGPKKPNRDKSPKRPKSKKPSKKEKKSSKKTEKKAPAMAKGFTKRFMPLDGDRDFNVTVIFEGTGTAPPTGELKSGEISRILLVAKNGLGDHPMLAVKNTKDKRWEFLTKEHQTKLIQRQELKTHTGEPITRAMIGAWLNRWPICDVKATNENDKEISNALEHYPIVSDTYAASMTQFKDIKFPDLGKRVAWSELRKEKKEEYPRPGHFYSEKENEDPSSSGDDGDDDDDDDDSSSEEVFAQPIPTDGSIASEGDQSSESGPKKPETPTNKTIRDFRKPLRGAGQPHMKDYGNGLKSLRVITASGELAAKTIEDGSIRPTVSMSRPLYPEEVKKRKAEPDKNPSPKRPKETEKKRKKPEEEVVVAVQKPSKAAKVEWNLSLTNSHWTAKKLLQGHAAMERHGKLDKVLDTALLTSLTSTKNTLEGFLNLPKHDFIRKVALNLLLELRFLELNKPGFASITHPMASFLEALGLLEADLDGTAEETIKAVDEVVKTVKQDAKIVKQECVIPKTEPATLIEHFKSGVLDNVTGMWMHFFMNPEDTLIRHDIGAQSEETIAAHSKAMNAMPLHRNQMLTLISAWKGLSAADDDDDSFDVF